MLNPTERATARIEVREAWTRAAEAQTAVLNAVDDEWPDVAGRPGRRLRDKADMRVVVMVDATRSRLELQTRRATWGLTLFSWGAIIVGLLGVTATLAGAGWEEPTGVWAGVALASLCLTMVGSIIETLHWPDGSPRSWRARPIAPAALEDLTHTLGTPHRASRWGLNAQNVYRFPKRIWLVPESKKAQLRRAIQQAGTGPVKEGASQ